MEFDSTHWEQYKSYNTTDDATTLLDAAEQLIELSERPDSGDGNELYWMGEALRGIGQRLSRLNTTYPYPDPIPEHWGPKPEGA